MRIGIKALDTMEELEKPLSCIEGRVWCPNSGGPSFRDCSGNVLALCRIAGSLASSPPFMLGFRGLLKFSAGGSGKSPKCERAGLEGYGLF